MCKINIKFSINSLMFRGVEKCSKKNINTQDITLSSTSLLKSLNPYIVGIINLKFNIPLT